MPWSFSWIHLRSTTAVRRFDLAICQARYLPPSPLPRTSTSTGSGWDMLVSLYGHHDFAELLVRLQVSMRLDDLLERECLGDDGLEASIGQPLLDEPFAPLKSCRVSRDFHQAIAAD